MDIVESILRVLAVGLLFGAGLPALFAFGLRLHAQGASETNSDGTVSHGNPSLRALGYLLYAIVAVIIFVALLWICRQTLLYYTGIQVFPDWAY